MRPTSVAECGADGFRDLLRRSRERGEPNEGVAATLLAEEIVAGRLELPNWNDKTEQWITSESPR